MSHRRLAALILLTLPAACGTEQPEWDGVLTFCNNDNDPQQCVWRWHHGLCELPDGTLAQSCPICDTLPVDRVQSCVPTEDDDGGTGGDGDGDGDGDLGDCSLINWEACSCSLDNWEACFNIIKPVLRERCEEKCETLSWADAAASAKAHDISPDGLPRCAAADWSSVSTKLFWTPEDGENCIHEIQRHVIPDGSGIDWSLAGTSSRDPVDCDLNSSCAADFTATIEPFIRFDAGTIPPDSRLADYKAATKAETEGVELELSFPGEVKSRIVPLVGQLEYSAADCASSGPSTPTQTCPFYLARADFWNDDPDAVVVSTAPDGTVVSRRVIGVQVELIQSVLGVWAPHDGLLAFPEGSLGFKVTLQIADCRTCPEGDGEHVVVFNSEEDAFGFFDTSTGRVSLRQRFRLMGGDGALRLKGQPIGHPPEAAAKFSAGDLDCNNALGFVFADRERNASVDPDGDLLFARWFVDRAIARVVSREDPRIVIPFGKHAVRVDVEDARGATSRAESRTVNVVDPTGACASMTP